MNTLPSKKLSLISPLLLALLTVACGGAEDVSAKARIDAMMAARHQQAVMQAAEEPHVEPGGFNFVSNGSDLYVYRDGQPVQTLFLAAGKTYPVNVIFVDVSGNPIDFSVHPPGEFAARVSSSNTNRVNYTATGYFAGNLAASSRGQATLSVILLHQGHPDYTASFPVEVRITN
jgi:hypothetical protein